jgi:undecaprenyl diphosphate synthase
VESIFRLLRTYLRLETERLRQHGARLEFIGRRDRLPPLLLREIARAEYATAEDQRLHLRIAVDYSSRDVIARAVAGMSAAIPLELLSADLVGRMLAQALTAESGEVDLLIRAGGEKRLSDFLLWESAYAELLLLTGCGRILTTPIWMPRSKNSTVGNGALAVFRKPPRTPPCQGRAVSDDGHF